MSLRRVAIELLPAILIVLLGAQSSAQESQLGSVKFKTSGSEKAQASFLRGLAALHSFWYEEALDAFRESTRIEPDFMMGYWGEAMAQNHPLWTEQDTSAAREVIAKIKDTPKLSERERAYLNAVKLLYGQGEKRTRDLAYSEAMKKIYQDYPDDLDAAAFYSLSLLGLVRPEEKSFRLQAQAGAIALAVYEKNPNHPGAAHYIIHAFDDPDHAILALPAARRYAGIAPAAHHALHMPAHIFLQLGMWPEAVSSNEAAWQASDAWMKRKNLSPGVRDYHSFHWLLYCYLQQGRYNKAEQLLALMKSVMSDTTYNNKLRPGYYESNYANMAAAFVVETERWDLTAKLFPEGMTTASAVEGSGTNGHAHTGATATTAGNGVVTVRSYGGSQNLPLFVRGMSAAISGSTDVEQSINAFKELRTRSDRSDGRILEIRELEISALSASVKGEHEKATELMKKAISLEEEMGPPSGPPGLIKPTHELFGEILLGAKQGQAAAEEFRKCLLRQPNRARSLLGLARATAQSGNLTEANATYAKLLQQWDQADEGLAPLREARDYLKQAKR